MSGRNKTTGFAGRTRKNLDYIENARRLHGADVHEVTQIVLSLLGLVVIPFERDQIARAVTDLTRQQMADQGWHDWKVELDRGRRRSNTLGDIVYHLRNSASHGRIFFWSDERDPEKVLISVEDAPRKNARIDWRAHIWANDLRDFCTELSVILDEGS